MSIIIRLQNLPWAANAMDIRQFFSGLQIPEGGVHIVGGELGDAFIAFSTDEDARQAFLRTDGKIKGIQIKLMLSSRTEMQRVIEQARNQSMAAFMLPSTPVVQPAPVPVPLPAAVPQVIPAAVPEIQKDSGKDRDDNSHSDKKRDRRRSRSKSRDRRDRSRDRRDRRHRDRSRSKSRDRRDRRRGRDRSRSRNRSRDRDSRSGRRDKAKTNDKRDDKEVEVQQTKTVAEIWASQPQAAQSKLNIVSPASFSNEGPGLLGPSPWGIESAVKNKLVANMAASLQPRGLNGFQPPASQMTNTGFGLGSPNLGRARETWTSTNPGLSRSMDFTAPSLLSNNRTTGFGNLSLGEFRGPRNDLMGNPNDSLRGLMMDSRADTKNNFGSKEDIPDLRMELNAKKTRQATGTFGRGGKKSRFEDADPPINACIALEPFYGSYGDLRRFFNGLSINYKGIKIINDKYGHKTGICFVQFRDATNKNAALKMSGRDIHNSEMKIKHISDKAFDEAIDRYNPRMDELNPSEDPLGRTRNPNKSANEPEIKDFVCLKIEDLPTFVKEQDILHIFSQHPLISLHLNFKPKGGTVAYVKFGSKEVAKIALNEKSHHIIHGKPITVKPCNIEEFNQENSQEVAALEEPKSEQIDTDCVSLSRLPAKTTDRDISDIFSDIGIIPTKMHLMRNSAGFNGQAYCEFSSKEEAAKAASKNNTVLGQDTISVKLIPKEEVEDILNNIGTSTRVLPTEPSDESPPKQDEIKQIEEAPGKSADKSTEPPKEESSNDSKSIKEQEVLSSQEQSPVRELNISPLMDRQIDLFEDRRPFSRFNSEIYDRPRGFENPHDFEHPRGFENPRDFQNPRNFESLHDFENPRRDFNNPHEFDSPHEFNRPHDFDNHYLEFDMQRELFHNSRGSFKGIRGNSRGSRFGVGGGSRFNPPRSVSPIEDDIPGCTVYMDNVPYKAGTNEILDFFEGYNCTNNVSRRYNPNNTPSAEAKVTFYNAEDAFRAVRELNGEKIWGRSIYLTQQ